MWIYAITRAVAEYNHYAWGFNPSPEYDYLNGKPQMDFMQIDYGKEHSYKYNETPPWVENQWREKYEIFIHSNGRQSRFCPYQPEVFTLKDNTKLFIDCCQDARYLENKKEDVREWFRIKPESAEKSAQVIAQKGILLDNNLTVINVRGGEYKGVPHLLLPDNYWRKAMGIMKQRNPLMWFICITDDVSYAKTIFPDIPVFHFSIETDYYIINRAHNLILSNSSFAIFPAWLNENNPSVIIPKYWTNYNGSENKWLSSDIWTFGWEYLGKGALYNANE